MSRMFSFPVIAAVLFLPPAHVMAGGPPQLCLPIDGMTAENAAVCVKRLDDKMGETLWKNSARRGIQTRQHETQWYAILYLRKDVKLSEIDAALKGTQFSVPRDKTHLFGRVILDIDVRVTASDRLTSDLETLKNVQVDESKRDEGVLVVTLKTPYWEPGRRDIFETLKSAADVSSKSVPAATARTLPRLGALRDVLAKHNATLKDIRWSSRWACRMYGCLAVADSGADTKVTIAD